MSEGSTLETSTLFSSMRGMRGGGKIVAALGILTGFITSLSETGSTVISIFCMGYSPGSVILC